MQSSCEFEDSSKLIFASCVFYSDRAYYCVYVLIKDIGRRLPLELACTRVIRVMLIDLSTETPKAVFDGAKIYQVEFTI